MFITAVPITKLFAWGGGETMEDMCYERRRAEACVDLSAHHALMNAGVGLYVVFITAVPSTKLFACVWGGYWRTCATRDDEPRPVWTSLPSRTMCVFILLQDLVQSCLCGGRGILEDMCYERRRAEACVD